MDDKELLKKSKLHAAIEKEAETEARKIEKESGRKAKKARQKLQRAAAKQKLTTDKIRRQNESLEHAKKAGISTYKHAENAKRQGVQLQAEKNAFGVATGLKAKMRNWYERDKEAENEIQNLGQAKDEENIEFSPGKASKNAKSLDIKANYSEEKETNEELKKILGTVNEIKKETEIQEKESHKQKSKLGKIMKANKLAEKETKMAEQHLDDYDAM